MERRILDMDTNSMWFQNDPGTGTGSMRTTHWNNDPWERRYFNIGYGELTRNHTYMLRDPLTDGVYEIPAERLFNIEAGRFHIEDTDGGVWTFDNDMLIRSIRTKDKQKEPELQIGDEKAFNEFLDSFKVTTSEELNK